jgi:hypothetical protein
MQTLLHDLHYGLRGLLKHRGFTIVAVLSLALGIGANTAIFSLINTILLKPLAFQDPDRLVMVWEDALFAGFPRNGVLSYFVAQQTAEIGVRLALGARPRVIFRLVMKKGMGLCLTRHCDRTGGFFCINALNFQLAL